MIRRTFMAAAAAALIAGTAASTLALTAGAAFAQTAEAKAAVDAAKAAGVVGEQSDGYLGFVAGGGDAALRAAVAEINAGRAQVYREAAARSGASPEAAGASAYTTVISTRLKPGEYYRSSDGRWVRK